MTSHEENTGKFYSSFYFRNYFPFLRCLFHLYSHPHRLTHTYIHTHTHTHTTILDEIFAYDSLQRLMIKFSWKLAKIWIASNCFFNWEHIRKYLSLQNITPIFQIHHAAVNSHVHRQCRNDNAARIHYDDCRMKLPIGRKFFLSHKEPTLGKCNHI